MIKRTIQCDVCGFQETESQANAGWPNWGQLNGIELNGNENPYLCPTHLSETADFVDSLVRTDGLD